MDQKMYMSLVRGFDWCVVAQEWQGYSMVKYVLPEYFQDMAKWNELGNGWQSQWHNELTVHIGEQFDYKWVPVGDPKLLTKEELEEMKNV